MLQRRLITATVAVVLTACAQADGTERGAIRENVIEPGLDAIDESRVLACGSEASSFRTVLDVYEVREGEPAPDEAALIAGDYVRSESELWDVVDGELVAQDPACGEVPTLGSPARQRSKSRATATPHSRSDRRGRCASNRAKRIA